MDANKLLLTAFNCYKEMEYLSLSVNCVVLIVNSISYNTIPNVNLQKLLKTAIHSKTVKNTYHENRK